MTHDATPPTCTTNIDEEEEVEQDEHEDCTSVRYRVSQRGDRVSVSGRRLVHGHSDQHLQPDDRSRRF